MKNTITKSTFKSVYLQLLVIAIIISPQMGMSQNVSNELLKSVLEKSDRIEGQVNQKLNLNSLKLADISNIVLDSVVETVNTGGYFENYRWYFKYNSNNQLISSEKHLKNIYEIPVNISTEYRTYNENNKMIDCIRIKTIERENLPDTTLTLYSEYNTYTNENLTEQHIFVMSDYYFNPNDEKIYIYSEDSISYTNSYEYNDKNQLIYGFEYHIYFPIFIYGSYEESFYYYNEDDLLKYKHNHYQTYKYDYQTVGDEYIKSEKLNYISYDNNTEIFDTITQWDHITYDTITYDELGRVKTLKHSYYNKFGDPILRKHNFIAEFEYNSYNQLTHASYYSYANKDDSTSYYESTRIDNTYDNEGNILEYHKTFYDAQFRQWVTHTKKTYYYSYPKSTDIAIENELTKLSIYPNPASDIINIKNSFNAKSFYTIYNLYGSILVKGKLENGTVDVSFLEPGFYLIAIETESGLSKGKFIKN